MADSSQDPRQNSKDPKIQALIEQHCRAEITRKKKEVAELKKTLQKVIT